MAARGIHHLGVAVEDLDTALATYERLFGAEVEHRATVEDQGVRAASLRIGEGRVVLDFRTVSAAEEAELLAIVQGIGIDPS